MPLFRLTGQSIEKLRETSFASQGVKERGDLQRLLKANIAAVADDVLIIGEEFCEWDDSRRRIDLLGIDTDANLVVFELKRDDEGGHMELQAIRYAAMVSTMTFDRACDVYASYLAAASASSTDARGKLLEFLGWDDVRDDLFAQDVRIVLVTADFSKELTTAVLWLNERDLDVKCVRIKPYELNGEIVVDVEQLVPLPEAEAYQVRVREKAVSRREAIKHGGEATGYWFMNIGDDGGKNPHRVWEDARTYGFLRAGGGKQWSDQVRRLPLGAKVFAYASGSGYVGAGEVVAAAVPQNEFVPASQSKRLHDLPMESKPSTEANDPEKCDWVVGIKWIETLDRDHGVLKNHSRRGTVEKIRRTELVNDLLKQFSIQQV